MVCMKTEPRLKKCCEFPLSDCPTLIKDFLAEKILSPSQKCKKPEISRKLNLDITQQRHIYSYDTEVFLEDKKLEPCEKDKEERVCKFSCAPDGLCIFVPNKIVKDFDF